MPVRVAGAGSGGRFRKVPECAGVGSGGGFQKVPESSFVKWCKFRSRFRKVPESSGVKWSRFRRQVPEGSGRFRRVPVYAGVGSGGRVRKVPESSGVRLLPCNLDSSSHVIALITGITLSTWAKPLRKKTPLQSKMA